MNTSSQIRPVAFLQPEQRTRHQVIHTCPKPHIHHYCDHTFARQDSLRRHFKVQKRTIPWNRDSLMDYCRRYIERTHSISPPELFRLAVIPSMVVQVRNQPMKFNHSKRNRVMSIKYLVS
ncbi:hypothetical protein BC833DRAFT_573571 [Globomyces pollinis-pini]|nr:hypothetical protein BC833DRAFT_573571 [Globomyces pollinis-pini]